MGLTFLRMRSSGPQDDDIFCGERAAGVGGARRGNDEGADGGRLADGRAGVPTVLDGAAVWRDVGGM
jgi:hypothetical protein